MAKTSLKKLQSDLKIKSAELTKLRDLVHKMESANELPALKTKYEGSISGIAIQQEVITNGGCIRTARLLLITEIALPIPSRRPLMNAPLKQAMRDPASVFSKKKYLNWHIKRPLSISLISLKNF